MNESRIQYHYKYLGNSYIKKSTYNGIITRIGRRMANDDKILKRQQMRLAMDK